MSCTPHAQQVQPVCQAALAHRLMTVPERVAARSYPQPGVQAQQAVRIEADDQQMALGCQHALDLRNTWWGLPAKSSVCWAMTVSTLSLSSGSSSAEASRVI